MGMHQYRPSGRKNWLRDPLKIRIAKAFGARIVPLRIDAKLSRRQVALRTGIEWSRVRKLEEGRSVPSLVDVVRFAELYQVKPGELLDEVVAKPKRGKTTLKSAGRKCLCERLGKDGRAALRGIVRKLAPHALMVKRRMERKRP